MSFDKTKAMRAAERFLSQGKIRSAISEYQRVAENDPKDFSTLNILGDLYSKNSEKQEAVECYTKVAEHYNRQGFAHKAIAIYNKISRLQPNSMEVSAKLAELYQSKGSIAEARTHYISIAEQHQRKGDKSEALAVWKQIAELDPNNTDIYLKIAENCQQEDQPDDAAKAYTEAGLRLSEQGQFEAAVSAFSKALEIKKNYLRALNGMVKAQIGLGDADEAAKILEAILKEQPYNRDILYLLVDCYLDMNKAAEAEQAVVKLVEQEPANYPKFLELVKIYLAGNDLSAAARILSMSSEHLLVGGQSEDFLSWTNEILAKNPEQTDALRLLARYYSWQRDDAELKNSLERLVEAAHLNDSVEDEKYALSQLVMLAPQETDYAKRLHELNVRHGFDGDEFVGETDLPTVADEPEDSTIVEAHQPSNEQNDDSIEDFNDYKEFSFAAETDSTAFESSGGAEFSGEVKEFSFYNEDLEATIIEDAPDESGIFEMSRAEDELNVFESELNSEHNQESKFNQETNFSRETEFSPDEFALIEENELKLADRLKLQLEVESIEFYIAQGYKDLAEKTLSALETEFGQRAELIELRGQLNSSPPVYVAAKSEEVKAAEQPSAKALNAKTYESFDELKDEFGVEETAADDGNDYDTHYHTATAYREMGLTEDAIKEFQNAINTIEKNDDTRRFFQCSILLGLCFMEKRMPNLAVMWYKRALNETGNLTGDEKQGLWYELGNAYETGGDTPKAVEYFEQIYALDVGYRDVVKRLQNLREIASQS